MATFIQIDSETIVNTDHITHIDVKIKKGEQVAIVMLTGGAQIQAAMSYAELIRELKRPSPLPTTSAAQIRV